MRTEPRPIDRAYAEINSLGGYANPQDHIEVAEDELLARVLAILERHGARDLTFAEMFEEAA